MQDPTLDELPPSEKRKRRREWYIIFISILSIILFTYSELHLSKLSSDAPFSSNILIFAIINIVILLIILLIYLVARNITKLFLEKSQNIPGARLRTKLVIAFVSLSLVPTLLLFFVSAGFITNSIQNWFNKQVEKSLKESMEVAQTYYKTSASNALYYAKQISDQIRQQKLLNDENLPRLKLLIRNKQTEYNLGVVEVYSAQREELTRATNSRLPLGEFTNPSSADISNVLQGNELTRINAVGKADLIRGIVPVYSTWNMKDVVGVVVVNYYVPYSLVSKMNEIKDSYNEFLKLKILKNPITTGYILTLFLITMVIIFLAVWFGIYLAKNLTDPIQQLANATREVAEGNLDVHLGEVRNDEIGMLISSFNKMTNDLKVNQEKLKFTNAEVIRSNQELEQRRLYMETVLRNVTAGVISADKEGNITTINNSALKLLNLSATESRGSNFRNILKPVHLEIVKEMLRELVINKKNSVKKQVSVPLNDVQITLLISLSILRDDNNDFIGTIIVFDDMTQLIKAQRMAAWREVARRIAHEIKNPLTPIQLSAQRLRKRYLEQFSDNDTIFDDCTQMIIKSVDELKTLVNEFSSFARMPASHPSTNNINELINEAVTLYNQAHRSIKFTFNQDNSLPNFQFDRDQIKRVFINLLENAVAAVNEQGDINVETSFNKELNIAVCSVSDNGYGISPANKDHLFEPYFSTKRTGTGLGLAIVNTIIADHNGFIRVKDNSPKGTKFIIELPVIL